MTDMDAINASLAREAQREEIAVEAAREMYGSADVEIGPPAWTTAGAADVTVESVDGGYWVTARVWIDADEVEGRLPDA